ncbi:MAG: ribose transport system substrate-binding protein [Gaiellales bacterium]|jgi:ABC-type sugar transport system substrate-binding protein|nr:ribose transport system substrate-binding protein [Gaiellales bacterium]
MARAAARAVLLAGLLATVPVACGGADDSGDGHSASLAAVIKGLDNPYFVTMHEGLERTARARGAPLSIRTAADLFDTAGQASKLEAAAAEHADCYIVNPINRANLVEPLGHLERGTPIVNIDSPVDQMAADAVDAAITTYIGTDNVAGGRLGAEAIAQALPAGARVVVVTGVPGDATSNARASGFRSGSRGRFRIARSVAADFDRQRAQLAAAELLRTDPKIQGFFAVNDEMALGIADALRTAGRSGELPVVGFDGTRPALRAVMRGELTATVSQYPYVIGQLGVEACLAAARGRSVPSVVDAPVQVVAKTNVARALANFPLPVERFDDPLAELLEG